ncbi:hypothetical protein FTUN_1971 [Frigoriglobus tundricola]|uniref:Uncharacterized protein n=1 Tax=Frigoriglobus tundricola TaxID=2774151 RepID=A0A6M5YMI7_9BACT|nr:hypothetical protein FTUN_1971 [Frigoriglobus tundricola]
MLIQLGTCDREDEGITPVTPSPAEVRQYGWLSNASAAMRVSVISTCQRG